MSSLFEFGRISIARLAETGRDWPRLAETGRFLADMVVDIEQIWRPIFDVRIHLAVIRKYFKFFKWAAVWPIFSLYGGRFSAGFN